MTPSAFLVAIVSILLVQVSATSVDPEQALFSLTRCVEIYAEPLQGSSREQAIYRWKTWSLESWYNDNTECYLQCVLERLGLFDPITRKLQPNKLDKQFDEYGKLIGVWSEDRNLLKDALAAMNNDNYNDCKALHGKFMSMIQRRRELLAILQKLYHYTKAEEKVYEHLTQQGKQIRAKKQSYFEFCEKKYYEEENESLCKIRQYQIDTEHSEQFRKLIECIFKGLRYIDDENNFNSTEIIRDYRLVNKPNFDEQIKQCTTKPDVVEAYTCFVEGAPDFTEAFKEAFDYREIRSSDYSYRLDNPVYSRQPIIEDVKTFDVTNDCK